MVHLWTCGHSQGARGAWLGRKLTSGALTEQQSMWRTALDAAEAALARATAQLTQLSALAPADRAAVLAADKWTQYWKGTRVRCAALTVHSRRRVGGWEGPCTAMGELGRVVLRVQTSVERERGAGEGEALHTRAAEVAAAVGQVGVLARTSDTSVRALRAQALSAAAQWGPLTLLL
jgi:hypothetical protein